MPCLSHVLIVLGGVLQIAGVAWAVVEVGKIRRSLVALRKAGQTIADEIRLMLAGEPERRDATVHAVAMSGVASAGGGTVTGTLTVGQPTLEQRVARMEAEIRRLDEQSASDRQEMRAEAKRAREHADAIDQELRDLIAAQEKQRRESQASAERLQRRIAPLLVIGLALPVVGSVVPC